MKIQYALIGILLTSVAHSANFGLYGNSISAHNIATTQHEIANRVFVPMISEVPSAFSRTSEKELDADEYGEMLYYGEFGDDTGVLPLVSGRNGGDISDNNLRIGWQHSYDKIKFKSHPHVKNTSDLIFAAYANEFNATRLQFFGGYAGSHTKNDVLDIDNDGAFIGAYVGKKFGDIELSGMADFGFAANDIGASVHRDGFNNFYAGIIGNVAYSYNFYDTVLLRPSLRAGYTWMNSASYKSDGSVKVTGKDFNLFELSPMFDVLSNIGDGLSVGGHFGYIMNFVGGGRQRANSETLSKLNINNYFEYGISLSQTFNEFSLNINFGRHDGAHSGWNGGAEFKYVF
ncbi:MAG: hypothetical protein J6Y07_01455 [Alphaproteobacteria bacterium]|nr:hypothetical protein [Alphaproteobacteria bacterium]